MMFKDQKKESQNRNGNGPFMQNERLERVRRNVRRAEIKKYCQKIVYLFITLYKHTCTDVYICIHTLIQKMIISTLHENDGPFGKFFKRILTHINDDLSTSNLIRLYSLRVAFHLYLSHSHSIFFVCSPLLYISRIEVTWSEV